MEFGHVSSSAYDIDGFVAKLNAKAADGWSVTAIVPTGGDLTAILQRDGAAPAAAADPAPVTEAAPAPAPVAEPAGWAASPSPVSPSPVTVSPSPASVSPSYTPSSYTPASTSPSYGATVSPTVAVTPAAPAAPATPATPANWYPDPSGRFELRYWDGEKWTEHVSRAGVQYTDAPVA